MKYLIAVVALALALAGCEAPALQEETAAPEDVTTLTYGVQRVVDTEAGVVCWVSNAYQRGGGLDCMLVSETRLDR